MRTQGTNARLHIRERAAWGLQVFVVLVIIWFGLNGLERTLVGILAAAAGGLLAASLATERPHPLRPLRLIAFGAFFLIESLRGGIDVAWRALQPAMPIQPTFVRFRHELPAGQPRTLLVSVMSLLPGTLSTDLVDDGGTLVVHLLTDDASGSVERLRSRIRWLFALPDGPA